eukprot:8914198-Pyramimonas_sp.AAC.1
MSARANPPNPPTLNKERARYELPACAALCLRPPCSIRSADTANGWLAAGHQHVFPFTKLYVRACPHRPQRSVAREHTRSAVSYTHLTLPTILLV